MAKKPTTVPVEAIAHPEDTRTNIPTREQQEAVAEEVRRARLHRNKAADPQLVWRGKDEQDDAVFEVPVLPIFIQEEVQPKALIEALKEEVHAGGPEQLDLFSPPKRKLSEGQRYDFYKHDADWRNRLILGDSLEVMVSLAEREGLGGKVQMVYMDPPYGIKFSSSYQPRVFSTSTSENEAGIPREPELIRAFRDSWEFGIHSYLSYIRDRLIAAHRLLTDTGSLFFQINDKNLHLTRCLLDEVFGRECYVVTLLVKKKGSQKSGYLDPVNDYVVWYSKSPRKPTNVGDPVPKLNKLYERRGIDEETLDEFSRIELPDGTVLSAKEVERDGETIDYRNNPRRLKSDFPGFRLFRPWPITNGGSRPQQQDEIVLDGKSYSPPRGRCWSHTSSEKDGSTPGMTKVLWSSRLISSGRSIDFKRYLDDFPYKDISNWWDGLGGVADIYIVQTNEEIVKRCMLMTTDPGDLVLDPTNGSGTSAAVAEHWGRRWIGIDSSRVSIAVSRMRLMSTTYPYFKIRSPSPGDSNDDAGQAIFPKANRLHFHYTRVPQITSGAFANAKGIREGMSPRQIEEIVRQEAPSIELVDEPEKDPRIVRVTGPFTVESLAPFVEIRDRDAMPKSEAAVATENERRFHARVLENLTRAGVQNKTRAERLQIASVRPFQGAYVHAIAETAADEGKTPQQIAVCIGPQYGTVGATLVKRALDEAAAAKRFDQVLVLGFAFDADAQALASPPKPARAAKGSDGFALTATTKETPRLALVLMAFDLLTEGLKSSKNANLFLVFGEPDVSLEKRPEGLFTVTVRGVDRYRFDDPIPKHVPAALDDDAEDEDDAESPAGGAKDAVACWFLDTNYDGECFRVRQAYFTGKGVFDKLAKALKADIDPAVWNDYYQTTSRPFPRPSKGNIAVKVIDDYGHEFLRVLPVRVEKEK